MATLVQVLQHALEQNDPLLPPETKRIILKEALQGYVLDFLYNHALYRRLNFYGGTCLHVIYDLNRLSEDLDFDNRSEVDLSRLADDFAALFRRTYGYGDTVVKQQVGADGIVRFTLKFPVLRYLQLASRAEEALHLKVEVSHHRQAAVIQQTPVYYHGRSFVPAHFSLETMMAGKMLACLERSFQRGRDGAFVKGRDFYDLLWFMQRGVRPLAEKLAVDGGQPYDVQSAMRALGDKIAGIRASDLAPDLLPMFASRAFIEAWLESFHANFSRFATPYLASPQ